MLAQRIAAALNAGITDVGFYWLTGLMKDGTIVIANNYGLGYIPEGVNLPENIRMATADESIPAAVRGTWATYPYSRFMVGPSTTTPICVRSSPPKTSSRDSTPAQPRSSYATTTSPTTAPWRAATACR